MNKVQTRKFLIQFSVIISVIGIACIVAMAVDSFSAESVKNTINIFTALVSGLGCGLYYLIVNNVGAADSDLKFKGALIMIAVIFITFEVIHMALGTTIQLGKR